MQVHDLSFGDGVLYIFKQSKTSKKPDVQCNTKSVIWGRILNYMDKENREKDKKKQRA